MPLRGITDFFGYNGGGAGGGVLAQVLYKTKMRLYPYGLIT